MAFFSPLYLTYCNAGLQVANHNTQQCTVFQSQSSLVNCAPQDSSHPIETFPYPPFSKCQVTKHHIHASHIWVILHIENLVKQLFKIPHTEDTKSLDRCGQKHQYFFVEKRKKENSIRNDSLFLRLYELVLKCTSPPVEQLPPRVDLPWVQSGTTPCF